MIAVLSIFAGFLGGLEQRKLKSLFAYSLISHYRLFIVVL
jgi:NADH:ubiquinone oxidoreductase subunit 2 (subunit N)